MRHIQQEVYDANTKQSGITMDKQPHQDQIRSEYIVEPFVIGFEKRAHFAQSFNLCYGLKSHAHTCIHCISNTNLKFNMYMYVSQQRKQLQTQNKV